MQSWWSDVKSEVKCGQEWWSLLRICGLHLTHPSAHTQQWTHTRGSGQHIAAAPGEQLGVRCLAQGSHLSCVIEGGRELWLFTSPTDNSCQTWESNPWPSRYKPRLPHFLWCQTINHDVRSYCLHNIGVCTVYICIYKYKHMHVYIYINMLCLYIKYIYI